MEKILDFYYYIERNQRLLLKYESMKKIFFDTSRIMIDDDDMKQSQYIRLMEKIVFEEVLEIFALIEKHEQK